MGKRRIHNSDIKVCMIAFALAMCLFGSRASATSMDSVVYAMDNQFENKIHAWRHGEYDEELRFIGSYETGGSGFIFRSETNPTNVLGSSFQVLQHNGFLFNVNAGSNSISTFAIRENGELELHCVTPTEGVFPVGLTAMGRRLCVITASGPLSRSAINGGDIECYRIRRSGSLRRDYDFENGVMRTLGPIGGGDVYLGTPGGAANPENNGPIAIGRAAAQIGFSPEGDALVALVKSTGVFVFPIVNDRLTAAKVFTNQQYASSAIRGITTPAGDDAGVPFSFMFKSGQWGQRYLVITEAIGVDGTGGGGGGISTFLFDPSADIPLVQIEDSVTRQGSPLLTPCWVVDFKDFLFTTNTDEGTVQAFRFNDRNGRVRTEGSRTPLPRGPSGAPIDPTVASSRLAVSTPRGTLPLDVVVSGDCFGKRFLYVVDGGFHRVVTYEIDEDTGDLDRLGSRNSGVYPIDDLDFDVNAFDRQVSGPAVVGIASICLPSQS